MKTLLINPPHPSIGSRIPHEHLPPLGLLAVGGPLIDAGHEVRLLDARVRPAAHPPRSSSKRRGTPRGRPDRPFRLNLRPSRPSPRSRAPCAQRCPQAWIIYGGVFPTYHWREILAQEPQIDVIVRGEGEETIRAAHPRARDSQPSADCSRHCLSRNSGEPVATPPAPLIRDLDAYRVGWELIDLSALQLLGRPARRGGAVLARLPAPLQLLRPARLLDALAAPRPDKLRRRAGLAPSRRTASR